MNDLADNDCPDYRLLMAPLEDAGEGWLKLVRAAEQPAGGRFLGGYEILDEIRQGGQALVFHARQLQTGREVALKRMAYGAFASPAEQRRFEREIDAVLALQHPGIVTVYGIENVGGVDVLAMEWVDGERLDAWAARCPQDRDGVNRRLLAFLQVCDAVQHAHQRGVIHRDLKPSNILVDDEGRCRVLDFGLARRLSASADGDATLTVGFVGTPAYAAPEHFSARVAPVDLRSDVYALGVVLYQLLSGQLPFVADGLRGLIEQIEERQPPRPSSLKRGIDRDLDAIVACAISKRPGDRYATVHALGQDVRRYLDGRPVLAIAPSATYVAAKWVRRHRVVCALSLLLLLVAAASVAVGIVQADRIRSERDTARLEGQRADRARDVALAAQAEAEQAEARAQAEAEKARAVADFYLDIVRDAAPSSPTGAVDFFEVLRKATARAREHFAPNLAWAIEVEANMAQTFSRRGRHQDAIEMATSALELQRTLADPVATSTGLLLRVLGETRADMNQVELALPLIEEALAVFEQAPEPPQHTLSATHYSLGRVLLRADRAADAERHFRAGMRIADAAGAVDNALGCRAGLASAQAQRGATAEAESTLLMALAMAKERDTGRVALWTIHTELGHLYVGLGRHADAVVSLRRSVELATEILTEANPERALSHFRLANALFRDGSLDEAGENFERAIELGLGGGELPIAFEYSASVLSQRGELHAAADRYGRARELYAAQYAIPAGVRVVAFANWLGSLIRAGQADRARDLLPDALAETKACAAGGGCGPAAYWGHLYEIGERLGQGPTTRQALIEALALLQASVSAGNPQVAEIAVVVEKL